jgi:hypothetical protein
MGGQVTARRQCAAAAKLFWEVAMMELKVGDRAVHEFFDGVSGTVRRRRGRITAKLESGVYRFWPDGTLFECDYPVLRRNLIRLRPVARSFLWLHRQQDGVRVLAELAHPEIEPQGCVACAKFFEARGRRQS